MRRIASHNAVLCSANMAAWRANPASPGRPYLVKRRMEALSPPDRVWSCVKRSTCLICSKSFGHQANPFEGK